MNNFSLTIKLALFSLGHNKLRSFLTMLGIIIGVAAVISILSLGGGAQSLITNALKNLGTDTLTVIPGNSNDNGPPASAYGITVTTLLESDAEAIESIPGVSGQTGFNNGNGPISFQSRNTDGNFSGVHANYPDVESHNLESGRFFTEQEERSNRAVTVLGADLKDELFPFTDPINQDIKILGESFQVIGVLERKGATLFENLDNRAFVPLSVAQNRLTGERHLDLIRVKVENESLVPAIQQEVKELLAYRHGIQNPDNIDFSVRTIAQALGVFTQVTNALSFFLAVIAAVSLVIGGISVTNIMLMTVKERTREIGLKKALGATPSWIQNQFLIETVVLTSVGGLLGMLCGFAFSFLVFLIMQFLNFNWSFVVSPISIVLAVFVSAGIGLAFGVYPARKAAQLNPIDSLRYE